MDPSDAVEERIRERAARLERFHDRITSCNVFVEVPHRHHQKGQLYEVHIHVRVPGDEIVVRRDGAHGHEDVYVAVRDAFAAMERQLEDFVRRRSA
jgi:ribosomal subunit interface protein